VLHVLDDLGATRPMIVHDGSSFAFTLAAGTRAALVAADRSEVTLTALIPGSRSYAGVARSALAWHADAVVFTGYDADAGPLVADLRGAGFTGPIVAGDGSASLSIVGNGPKTMDDVYVLTPPLAETTATAADWTHRYTEFTHTAPGPVAMVAYSAVMVAADAIERAGSTDSAKVIQALRKTAVSAPYGTVTFDDRQVARTAFQVVSVKDGHFTPACLGTPRPAGC
jgi:branched-chain amino acid transport system substrate-binding protein